MAHNLEVTAKSRRDEIEQALAERQKRISERVDAVQSFIPSGTGGISGAVRRLSGRRVLPVVAAAGVFLLVRGLRSRRWTPYEEGLDHVSERLADTITEHIKRGDEPTDAVRLALEKHPPILELRQSRGIIGLLFHQFSQSISTALSKELVHRVTALVDRRRHSG